MGAYEVVVHEPRVRARVQHHQYLVLLTPTHAHAHTHTLLHTPTQSRTHAHTERDSRTHAHTRTHPPTPTHWHAHTHTLSRTHPRTGTRTPDTSKRKDVFLRCITFHSASAKCSLQIAPAESMRTLRERSRPTLETTQGQTDGFFSQLLFKFYFTEVASVGD